MAFDTQALNKTRQNLTDYEEIWVFGYGSLIYKVDFDYLQCQNAYIDGYERRFWQGSHDHRGTPDNPGRVLTLTEATGAKCFGSAIQVNHDVFDHLDHREKNGYLRHDIAIHLADGRQVNGLIYIASPDNAAYLGRAPIADIARQIYQASGPSGPNREYVYRLADALRAHGEDDEHVFAIEARLKAYEAFNGRV